MRHALLPLLSLALLAAPARSDSPDALPPTPLAVVADTGIVTLGPNQVIRVTAVGKSGEAQVRFRRFGYDQGSCTGDVCGLALASQSTSALTTLPAGNGASTDMAPTSHGVRAQVLSTSALVKIQAVIWDETTNQIIAILIG